MVCPCGRPQIFFIKEQIYLQAISWANNPSCFIAGTLVLAKEGKKAIESIEPGDEVLAYDEQSGDMQYKKVARVFRNTTDKWCTVTVEVNGKTEKITSTPGHKYYLPFNSENREKDLIPEHANYITLSDKWVSACKLKPGDKVLLFNKTYAIIKAVEVVCLSTPEVTYNFEVKVFHTYFVGYNPILVHNACEGKFFDHKKDADHFVKYKNGKVESKAYHQARGKHAGLFVSKDTAQHGGSAFKLLKQQGNKLQLIGDLDEYGNFISAKHSSHAAMKYVFYGKRML